jgi:hypothetical protein
MARVRCGEFFRTAWSAIGMVAALQLAAAGTSFAQKPTQSRLDYPTRPVRLIVTSEAGSADSWPATE